MSRPGPIPISSDILYLLGLRYHGSSDKQETLDVAISRNTRFLTLFSKTLPFMVLNRTSIGQFPSRDPSYVTFSNIYHVFVHYTLNCPCPWFLYFLLITDMGRHFGEVCVKKQHRRHLVCITCRVEVAPRAHLP